MLLKEEFDGAAILRCPDRQAKRESGESQRKIAVFGAAPP
jgi:hypothetical protein